MEELQKQGVPQETINAVLNNEIKLETLEACESLIIPKNNPSQPSQEQPPKPVF